MAQARLEAFNLNAHQQELVPYGGSIILRDTDLLVRQAQYRPPLFGVVFEHCDDGLKLSGGLVCKQGMAVPHVGFEAYSIDQSHDGETQIRPLDSSDQRIVHVGNVALLTYPDWHKTDDLDSSEQLSLSPELHEEPYGGYVMVRNRSDLDAVIVVAQQIRNGQPTPVSIARTNMEQIKKLAYAKSVSTSASNALPAEQGTFAI